MSLIPTEDITVVLQAVVHSCPSQPMNTSHLHYSNLLTIKIVNSLSSIYEFGRV